MGLRRCRSCDWKRSTSMGVGAGGGRSHICRDDVSVGAAQTEREEKCSYGTHRDVHPASFLFSSFLLPPLQPRSPTFSLDFSLTFGTKLLKHHILRRLVFSHTAAAALIGALQSLDLNTSPGLMKPFTFQLLAFCHITTVCSHSAHSPDITAFSFYFTEGGSTFCTTHSDGVMRVIRQCSSAFSQH